MLLLCMNLFGSRRPPQVLLIDLRTSKGVCAVQISSILGSRRRTSAHNFWDPRSHSEWLTHPRFHILLLNTLLQCSPLSLHSSTSPSIPCATFSSIQPISAPHSLPPPSHLHQHIFMHLFNSALPPYLHNASVNSSHDVSSDPKSIIHALPSLLPICLRLTCV